MRTDYFANLKRRNEPSPWHDTDHAQDRGENPRLVEEPLPPQNSDTDKEIQAHSPLLGAWIEFDSPLFGVCSGRVVMEEGEMVVVDDHSVLHNTVTIPRDWVRSLKYDGS